MLKELFLGRQPSHFHLNSFVRTFIIADSLLWSGWNFVFPIFALFVTNNVAGGSIEIAATAYSVHLITRIIFELLSGKNLSKATETKKILATIVGMFFVGLGFLGFAFVSTVFFTYLLYGLTGAGLGIASPAKNSLFSTHLDKNREATEWGMYDASAFIGMALSGALGGFVAGKYGFDVLFFASAAVIWAAIIPYLFYVFGNTTDPHLQNERNHKNA